MLVYFVFLNAGKKNKRYATRYHQIIVKRINGGCCWHYILLLLHFRDNWAEYSWVETVLVVVQSLRCVGTKKKMSTDREANVFEENGRKVIIQIEECKHKGITMDAGMFSSFFISMSHSFYVFIYFLYGNTSVCRTHLSPCPHCVRSWQTPSHLQIWINSSQSYKKFHYT